MADPILDQFEVPYRKDLRFFKLILLVWIFINTAYIPLFEIYSASLLDWMDNDLGISLVKDIDFKMNTSVIYLVSSHIVLVVLSVSGMPHLRKQLFEKREDITILGRLWEFIVIIIGVLLILVTAFFIASFTLIIVMFLFAPRQEYIEYILHFLVGLASLCLIYYFGQKILISPYKEDDLI